MVFAMLSHPEVRRELILTHFRANLLFRTLGYNGAAAILATLMGLPAGLVLGRGRGRVVRALWVFLPAALLLPSLAYAYGWKQLVRLGMPAFDWLDTATFHIPVFGTFHSPIHITFIANGPADIMRCVWSLASWLWAAPAGLIGLALRRMDTSVQQQSVMDGVLWRVTFRQLLGPIVASIAIVTVLATQEFAVYEPTGISVIATEVRMVFDTGSLSSADNSIAGPVAQGEGRMSPDQAARAAAAVATSAESLSVGQWPPILDAPAWATFITVVLLVVNIAGPVASLFASLHRSINFTRMYLQFGPQIVGSIEVAFAAAAVAALAAFSSAARWTRGMIAVAGASFLIGGQLLAIALIRIFNRSWLDAVYDSDVIIVIAYVGRFGWLALAGGWGAWSRPWRELREIAAVDGAGPWRTALSVVWPLAWPTLLASGLLVGALSLTEVPATVLIMPPSPQVLTPTMMTWVHAQRSDPMIEASLLLMFTVLFPAVAAVVLYGMGVRVGKLTGQNRP
jgi:ABC-type Fe3+ transport system permease subunit